MRRKITVLGAGSWGTALAQHLATAGHEVTLWGRDDAVLKAIKGSKENPKYFPGITLSTSITTESSIKAAVAKAQAVLFSVPAKAIREVCKAAKGSIPAEAVLVSTAKGLEVKTLKPVSEILSEEFGAERVAVLSGPSFALEVVTGKPTAVTIAAENIELADKTAELFHHENFRVYTSTDVVGVEFGGILKNVLAIATGVCDGLNVGLNARAAIVTRGLAEMTRLIVALGGDPATVSGLSGLGDVLLTTTGDLSRNRRIGLALGHGKSLEEASKEVGQVAEGVQSTAQILALAKKHKVDVPIIEEVCRVLEGKARVEEVATALLSRRRRKE